MNERIKQLWDEAAKLEPDPSWEGQTRFMELFAEAIIRECCIALNPMLRDMISRGQGQELIRQHFRDVEPNGWVCPKCGIDRTKNVCPKGDTAVLTGDCPMIATAQTVVKE